MMLALTNANPDPLLYGKELLISVRHIVSLRPVKEGTSILTATGVTYLVSQTTDEIGQMNAWRHLWR